MVASSELIKDVKTALSDGTSESRSLSHLPYIETRDIPSTMNKSTSGKQMQVSQMENTGLAAVFDTNRDSSREQCERGVSSPLQ